MKTVYRQPVKANPSSWFKSMSSSAPELETKKTIKVPHCSSSLKSALENAFIWDIVAGLSICIASAISAVDMSIGAMTAFAAIGFGIMAIICNYKLILAFGEAVDTSCEANELACRSAISTEDAIVRIAKEAMLADARNAKLASGLKTLNETLRVSC